MMRLLPVLLTLMILIPAMQSAAAAPDNAHCLEFRSDQPTPYLANPATKTIETLPKSMTPHAYNEDETGTASPDGRYIAQMQQQSLLIWDNQTQKSYEIPADTLERFEWSPDSSQLAFVTHDDTRGINIVNADGSNRRTENLVRQLGEDSG